MFTSNFQLVSLNVLIHLFLDFTSGSLLRKVFVKAIFFRSGFEVIVFIASKMKAFPLNYTYQFPGFVFLVSVKRGFSHILAHFTDDVFCFNHVSVLVILQIIYPYSVGLQSEGTAYTS